MPPFRFPYPLGMLGPSPVYVDPPGTTYTVPKSNTKAWSAPTHEQLSWTVVRLPFTAVCSIMS